MLKPDSKQLLRLLTQRATLSSRHPLEGFGDLVRECGGIVSASRTGFTVEHHDGCQTVEFSGGLQKEHYFYFAPILEAFDQAQLALAVLQNQVRFTFCDWHTAKTILCQKYGTNEEAWLPEKIEGEGFNAVAAEVTACLVEYRRLHPAPRWIITVFQSPTFDSTAGLLSFGEHEWGCRKQDGPVWKLLCELERRRFPRSVCLKGLAPDKVRDARKLLHKKTAPIIKWSAHADGYLSWSLGVPVK